ncbi:hypothetical protein [Thermithiobacillus plumbiphilus]|uniref:DNA topoisomerase n=1 Tax=Thermithiobacillus plumbiphilus TaxID=1729899 RepID=A0ABU9DAH0_9PROT
MAMAKHQVTELKPQRGWRRLGSPKTGFRYVNARGEPVRAPAHLQRIQSLHIPPGWRDVRISPSHKARLQATGYDSKGRKQYIYHPDYVATQNRQKFARLLELAEALPRMRETTNAHLHETGLPREKVLAAVLRLINETYFRIGSERYARQHRTFGITSLRKRHCRIEGNHLVFAFRGKHGVAQRRIVTDALLVGIIAELLKLPGPYLFQYVDPEKGIQRVCEKAVNSYVRQVLHADCTAKDFRTFGGSLLAARILDGLGPPESDKDARRKIASCIRQVAERLGNTPAVARSSYIHPQVLDSFQAGRTLGAFQPRRRRLRRVDGRQSGHYPEELAFLALLRECAANSGQDHTGTQG